MVKINKAELIRKTYGSDLYYALELIIERNGETEEEIYSYFDADRRSIPEVEKLYELAKKMEISNHELNSDEEIELNEAMALAKSKQIVGGVDKYAAVGPVVEPVKKKNKFVKYALTTVGGVLGGALLVAVLKNCSFKFPDSIVGMANGKTMESTEESKENIASSETVQENKESIASSETTQESKTSNEVANSSETTITSDITNTYSNVEYTNAVSDMKDITSHFKELKYFENDRELQLTQDAVNSLYFMANCSEMSKETTNLLINNKVVRNSSKAIIDDTRNALEISAVEDNHYAKGDSETYMDLSMFFKNEEALTVYNNYVNALKDLKNMGKNDKEAIEQMYSAIYAWAIDNNSKLLGNPKSVNYGTKYIMNQLIRKNILATMLEKGLITRKQYDYVVGTYIGNDGKTYGNTEITKTNDVQNLLGNICGEVQTYGGLTAEEVKALIEEYHNQQAPETEKTR